MRLLLPAQINLQHPPVGLHLIDGAFAEVVARVEDGDFAGDLADKDHGVPDDDDTVFSGEADEQLAGLGGRFVGHAGGGFVHKEALGIWREQQAELEPLLLAVGETASLPISPVSQCYGDENLPDALAQQAHWSVALASLVAAAGPVPAPVALRAPFAGTCPLPLHLPRKECVAHRS